MRGNPGLDLAYTCERAVPSQLQFRRDQPVLRIDGVVLPECPIGAVARRLEVAHQRITNLIAAAGRLCFGLDGRSYRSRFDNPQKSFLDGVVDTQSSECDAAWLAIVERTPPTGIARNVMLGAGVALGGQVQPMLDEPEQGLPDTAEFGHLVEDEDDGFLDTAIGILLEPVADLHEADRGSDDEFATPGLLIAGRQGTVAQKIELILVEAAL